MTKSYDMIVVGSGIAGLSFALKVAAQNQSVALITKKTRAESNTNHAQGGIASVTSQADDFNLHLQDTLEAGDGLCNEKVVREIVQEGPEKIKELIEIGVHFTQLEDGQFSLGKEGGHSKRRILHVKDITGKAIESALIRAVARQKNIEVFEHYLAIDLITQSKLKQAGLKTSGNGDRVHGLYTLNTQNGVVETFRGRAVMLATGGVGHVYQYTTNPDIATGDGIAMAYRAGAEINNMEFIQFHPTALYTRDEDRFLISEAVRGEGAILRNSNNRPFMKYYHRQADLAPRDIVARAIDREMKKSGSRHVWLDITGHPEEILEERFPNIYKKCQEYGINISSDYIPVVPAAHYLCGGIVTDEDGKSSVSGLYACGEVASTGLHGANRLASNSLLEAVVMADRAARDVGSFLKKMPEDRPDLPDWVDGDVQDSDERVVLFHNWDELKRTMWDYVGIVRTTKRLERARTRIKNLGTEIHDYYWNFKVETRLLELRNMIQVADLIVECALKRKESRGLHFTLDYPEKRPESANSTVRRRQL